MALTALRSRFARRASAEHDQQQVTELPKAQWDNVGLAVDRAINLFVGATADLPGIRRIDAMSSGPIVRFRVIVDGPWDIAIDRIEERLFPIAKDGQLPPLDYDVREAAATNEIDPGYITVYPA